jgi:hypothetical protein
MVAPRLKVPARRWSILINPTPAGSPEDARLCEFEYAGLPLLVHEADFGKPLRHLADR